MGAIVPQGYTRIREAIFAIAEIRYAGLAPAEAVKAANAATEEELRIRFTREELQECAGDFWAAVDTQTIGIQIEHMPDGNMLHVSPDLLDGIPCLRRYSVSNLRYLRRNDLLTRHLQSRFPHAGPVTRADWLERLQLLVENAELQRLGKKLRNLRKRQKSRPASVNPVGRPSKSTSVKPVIRDVIEAGKWAYPDTLGRLTNLVNKTKGHSHIPVSDSTVARALDELFLEMSDNRYSRPKRSRKEPPTVP